MAELRAGAPFAGFGAIFVKETKELVREKRLAVLLLSLACILALPFTLFRAGVLQAGFSAVVYPLVFVLPILLLVAAITFAADMVAKEKDSGMIGLILSAPVSNEGFVLAKIAGAYVAYAAIAAVVLLFTAALAPSFGTTILLIVAWFFAIPLLVLWTFLVGLFLPLSVLLKSSKGAIGVGLAAVLPLLLVTVIGPLGGLIRSINPTLFEFLSYNPIAVSFSVSQALVVGSSFDAMPLLVDAAAGVALMAIGYALFRRQEVLL